MIKINDLKIFGYHGLYEIEKKEGQVFLLNVSYRTYQDDGNGSHIAENEGESKEIIDYIQFTKFLLKSFNHQRHNYLENLVDRLIKDIHSIYRTISYIKISIYKEKIDTSDLDSKEGFEGLRNIGIEVEKNFGKPYYHKNDGNELK